MSKRLERFKIGDLQKLEEEYEKQQQEEKRRKKEMFASFKKHGVCPDYKEEECRTKIGVYACWDTDEHRKYRCPVIDYSRR